MASASRVVAIDIDEVLGHFVPQLCLFHNEKYGTSLQLKDFYSYNFWEVWGGTRDEATTKCYEFFESDHFANLPPVPGAFDALKQMKQQHSVDLVVVTSRQLDIEEATKAWLDRHYPDLFSKVRFGHHYAHAHDTRRSLTKAEICAELGATILVDDSLIYARQCAQTLQHVILFDHEHAYPWNKTSVSLPENVSRVASWQHALEVFEKVHCDSPTRAADSA